MVKLGTLEVGSAFIADWRPEGRNIGEVVDRGVGSVTVRIPESDGSGWERTPWSHGTDVIPTTREALNSQSLGSSGEARNRSTADNPVERVHQICAELGVAKRDEIWARCVAEGININTAKTQYYVYRKKQK